ENLFVRPSDGADGHRPPGARPRADRGGPERDHQAHRLRDPRRRGGEVLMRTAIIASMLALAGCSATQQPASTEARSRRATLLFFSDAHAQLEEHPELFWTPDGRTEIARAGGYARLAHVVNEIRRETRGRALLIDGGDTFQGSGPAAWSQGEVVLAPQRALGVDLGLPGNWEVVYGPARMREL